MISPDTAHLSPAVHRCPHSSINGGEGFQAQYILALWLLLNSGSPQETLICNTSGHCVCISIPRLILISILVFEPVRKYLSQLR
jgi:hypothetical protein